MTPMQFLGRPGSDQPVCILDFAPWPVGEVRQIADELVQAVLDHNRNLDEPLFAVVEPADEPKPSKKSDKTPAADAGTGE